MQVAGDEQFPEDMRLNYRFIDLRREKLHRNMMLRAAVIASIRRRMIEQGFTEFQTPILTASSPEGARDFLVPARLHPGKFYALPQAPQQFKQLLMVAGFDRYFQIAPCFRDEASRADRSPGEFYQLDFEMSFVTQEDVFATIEPVIAGVFEEFADGRAVTPPPFPRIPYDTAMLEYGSRQAGSAQPAAHRRRDASISPARASGCSRRIAASGGVVRAIPAPGAGEPAAQLLRQAERMGARRGRRRARLHRLRGGRARRARSPRNLEPERAEAIRAACGLQPGDAVFFAAGKRGRGAEIRRRGAHPARRGTRADREGRVPLLLDHRFPDVRAERGNRADRFQPQPVQHAAGRAGGAEHAGPADHQGVPVRHRVQRRSSCPRAPSATIGRTS